MPIWVPMACFTETPNKLHRLRNDKRKHASSVESDRSNMAYSIQNAAGRIAPSLRDYLRGSSLLLALNHKGQEDLDTSRFLHKVRPYIRLTNGPQRREPKRIDCSENPSR